MLLGAWRTSRLVYRFDREGGRYQRLLVRLGISLPTSGFGAVERTREHGKMFFCIYRWDGRIVFQAGTRRWHLDRTDLKLEFRRLPGGRSSELSVHEGGALVFRCSYRHWLRAVFPRRDTTEDDTVDLERNHFLAHVAGRTLPVHDFDAWEDGKTVEAELAALKTTPPDGPAAGI
jgi:hypothetical protein